MSSTRRQPRHGFKPKLIALSVAACFSLSSAQSQANPTGGTVTSGSASFAVSGNTVTITNAPGTIINWASFSIGINEITQFLQSSGASAVLNRVVGLNGVIPQSVIDGILSSNGRVFLLNQSGIVIGSTARIDVAGLVASSLNLSDQDFLAGRLRFTETPGAGGVSNAGIINTTSGGQVFLVGSDVQNSGIIRSPEGQIVLAAGKSVELVSEGSPFVTVNITADNERALNVGQLISDSGRIGMFGALVRQSGVIEANSAVAGANGEIRLVATKDLTLDAGSRTTANGPGGGSILLQAQGGTNLIYGTVEATGSSGQGGTIQALGVRVGVLGYGVIDASGDAGGGTILIGGDQHGDNPNVQNAEQVLIGPDGVIRADAGTTGDGGRVIVWSDAETRVFGSISAQGGAQSGNGGFVETSSRGGMDLTGIRVDTRAANGQWGTWLLDPDNVIFEPNSYGGGDPLIYGNLLFGDNPGTTAHITAATVEAAFATNGTVQVQATNNVNFSTDLNLNFATPGGLFEVRAQNDIDMAYAGGPHTIFTNGQNVVLSANDLGLTASVPTLNPVGTGSIIGGGNIIANAGGGVGGNITLRGYGVNVGTLQTAGSDTRGQALNGNVTITALAGGVQTGNITTNGINGTDFTAQPTPPTAGGSGGNVTITTSGAVATGNIEASGGSGGNGGFAGGVLFSGGAGGSGGFVTIGGGATSINTGAIASNGGVGGYGGSGGTAAAQQDTVFQVAYGGAGGAGGIVSLTSAGNVTTGAITLTGAAGGAGGANNNATVDGLPVGSLVQGIIEVGHGGGGGIGGSLDITGNAISTDAIVATGGAGGAGGAGNSATATVSAVYGELTAIGQASSGAGGSGGTGGDITFIGSGSTVVSGTINTSGGAGGAGGANGVANATVDGLTSASNVTALAESGSGGAGGNAGFVDILTAGNVSTGAIAGTGGTGGSTGTGTSVSASASTLFTPAVIVAMASAGAGGAGGAGASLDILSLTYGGLSVGSIDVSGANGGTGGSSGGAGVYGGAGGNGGSGGLVSLQGGSISIVPGGTGTISATGGIAGAGGAASAGFGGKGGIGGSGGQVFLIAESAPGVLGTIQGANISVAGGAAGAGGIGGGLAGVDGLSGSIFIFGNLGVRTSSELDTNTIIQATNRLLAGDIAPTTEEVEKKNEENKQKKGAAVCK